MSPSSKNSPQHERTRRNSPRARGTRHGNHLLGLAARSRTAHVDEQPRSRGCRATGRLVVYGGNGRAARSWEAFDAIVRTLRRLKNDETLIVQSGKPVAVWKTHARAPRVLIANANLVPKWADWSVFRELEAQGLTMYGQMTAGSWIYIGTQGIVQGTYETFAELARQHFGGSLERRVTLDRRRRRHGRRAAAGHHDERRRLPDRRRRPRASGTPARAALSRSRRRVARGSAARGRARKASAARRSRSVTKETRPTSFPQLYDLGFRPDAVTDQTSAHDLLDGYVPAGLSLEEAAALRKTRSATSTSAARSRAAAPTSQAMVRYLDAGAVVFDYGNNIRAQAERAGFARAFAFPGFVPAFIRPLFCRGSGPFRFAALSGDPADIARCDAKAARALPRRRSRWRAGFASRANASPFKGLPARICWLGYGDRAKAGLAFNELVRSGEVKAPIVIGRDHLDTGSVASPYRETEAMKDGSDAIADWPILNALLNTAAGAHWVSFHHGGGVGIGYSLHAGMVVVADGSDDARERLRCVLDDRSAAWASCATPTPATSSRSKRPTRKASIGVSDRPRQDDRYVRYRCRAVRHRFRALGRIDDAAILIENDTHRCRRRRARELKRRRRRRRATSIWATASSCPASSTRTPIRSMRAIASRTSRRACAARSRRSECSTRSSGRARRCSIRRRSTSVPFGRACTPCSRTARRRWRRRRGYALHKPGEAGAARSDRRASRRSPTFRASSRRFWGRTRFRRSSPAKSASSTISSIKSFAAAAAHGAVYADAFCEPGFFSPEQTRRYLDAADLHGMRLRVHCDEMAYGGAAEMATQLDVDAVDHCNFITDERRSCDRRARHRYGRVPGDDRVSRSAAPRAGPRAARSRRLRSRWRAITIRERRRASTCRRLRILAASSSDSPRPRRSTA